MQTITNLKSKTHSFIRAQVTFSRKNSLGCFEIINKLQRHSDPTSIRHQTDINPTSIRRQTDVKQTSNRCQTDVKPMSTRCQTDVEKFRHRTLGSTSTDVDGSNQTSTFLSPSIQKICSKKPNSTNSAIYGRFTTQCNLSVYISTV